MASHLAEMGKAELVKLAERRSALVEHHRESAERLAMQVGATGIQMLTGLAMGVAEEAYGERAVMGVDIPVVLGVPTGLAALFGVGGRNGLVALGLQSVSNACGVIWTYKKGGQLYLEYQGRQSDAGSDVPVRTT